MRRFLLASHLYFAEGICGTLKLITGENDRISYLCAYTTEDYDLQKEVESIITTVAAEDELIIITDVYGGSVNNAFMEATSRSDKKIYLIAGLNLGLLMNLVMRADDPADTRSVIRESLDEAKKYICLCEIESQMCSGIADDEF